jgi:hypothetical protein
MPSMAPQIPPPAPSSKASLNVRQHGVPIQPYTTEPDEHGLYRVYPHKPSYVPDLDIGLEDLCDAPGFDVPAPTVKQRSLKDFVQTTWIKLFGWFFSSPIKSLADFQGLVDIMSDEDFRLEDVVGKQVTDELAKVDASPAFMKEAGWKKGTVRIPLPCPRVKCPESQAPTLDIPDVFHRSWPSVIKETFEGSDFKNLHLTPFEMHQKRSQLGDTRVFSEIYNSDVMIQEHIKLQAKQNLKDEKMEVVVAAIMNWSDSTHLAQFGNASLWPLYSAFGNMSKYIRNKPKSYAFNHMAYIPSVRHSNVHLLYDPYYSS